MITSPMDQQPVSVIMEAERLINGEKRQDYGAALESFSRIAALWTHTLGVPVTPEQVALCMVQLKIARWVHGQQRDSLVDGIGYLGLIEKMREEKLAANRTQSPTANS